MGAARDGLRTRAIGRTERTPFRTSASSYLLSSVLRDVENRDTLVPPEAIGATHFPCRPAQTAYLRRTSASSDSVVLSRWRCSRATPSSSSPRRRTRSRMLDSVRMLARIWSMTRDSKRLALSRGASQASRPRLSRDWQT